MQLILGFFNVRRFTQIKSQPKFLDLDFDLGHSFAYELISIILGLILE